MCVYIYIYERYNHSNHMRHDSTYVYIGHLDQLYDQVLGPGEGHSTGDFHGNSAGETW